MNKHPHCETTKRVSHQHIWTRNTGILKQSVEFFCELLHGGRSRTGLTPASTSTIIGADPRGLRYFWLYPATPTRRPIAHARVDHHGGTAAASAVEVQTIPADIHQLARRRISLCIRSFCH